MPEPYAVRVGANGSKQYYKTKADYQKGKFSSFGRTNQRLKKSFSI